MQLVNELDLKLEFPTDRGHFQIILISYNLKKKNKLHHMVLAKRQTTFLLAQFLVMKQNIPIDTFLMIIIT